MMFMNTLSMECPSTKTIKNIGGVHQMVGLQDRFFIASPSDSVESLPEYGSTNRVGAAFETPSGRRLVSDNLTYCSIFLCKFCATYHICKATHGK
jgi:hypothetical protein